MCLFLIGVVQRGVGMGEVPTVKISGMSTLTTFILCALHCSYELRGLFQQTTFCCIII